MPRCPAASISTSAVLISRSRCRSDTCFSPTCFACSPAERRAFSSLCSWSAVASISARSFLRVSMTCSTTAFCSRSAAAPVPSPLLFALRCSSARRRYSASSSTMPRLLASYTRSSSAKACSIACAVLGALLTKSIFTVGMSVSSSRTRSLCSRASCPIASTCTMNSCAASRCLPMTPPTRSNELVSSPAISGAFVSTLTLTSTLGTLAASLASRVACSTCLSMSTSICRASSASRRSSLLSMPMP